jgi:hypothetical protein
MTIRMTSTRSVPYSFPLCLGKPYHEQHDKEGMERMQNDAGQVMAERIESPDSVVESMRNPGNRVPVTFIRMEKAPREKSILKKRMALFAITWSLSSHAPMNPFQRAGRYTINVMTELDPRDKSQFFVLFTFGVRLPRMTTTDKVSSKNDVIVMHYIPFRTRDRMPSENPQWRGPYFPFSGGDSRAPNRP